MDQHQDDFRDLRRLLALKRYEQPPPAYYHSFSARVIARIEAGELHQPSWFMRLWESLQAKPSFAGAMSFAVCGLIAAGVLYSEAPSNANVGAVPGFFQTADVFPTAFDAPETPVFSSTNAFLPPALRGNVFAHPVSANPLLPMPRVQTLKWTQ